MAALIQLEDADTKKPVWINPGLVMAVKALANDEGQTEIIWADGCTITVLGSAADTAKKLTGTAR
jgi:hypothetical protein